MRCCHRHIDPPQVQQTQLMCCVVVADTRVVFQDVSGNVPQYGERCIRKRAHMVEMEVWEDLWGECMVGGRFMVGKSKWLGRGRNNSQ